ncbi:BirA family biotin operon repressor/biotin-[acetyl-CoA-carboxylase] ligase [Agitococcus lubricus]|uniref:Bifunctional ligase/repressor BirA n=2 Tax=Agitococcus lubricus TaxID=1077255 RepID=A0A2T5J0P2_9GAMM|nr:BirA family biotin operon repressor/biotin-[acetyl-CoA-carboxylase] ligase [Agitococcus lubricus]
MDILELLADGQLHSGVELAQKLGVSRTTVSNYINQWIERGLAIETVSGKGYRLPYTITWLDKEKIQQGLSLSSQQRISQFQLFRIIGSTNDEAAKRIASSQQSGVVCIAEMQEAGRGRRGRAWLSPVGANFYGSVAWIYGQGFAVVEGLSLAVGVAVIEALADLGVQGLSLKWPNDILWHGQKLGGVLIEMTGEVDGSCQVVLGLGINVKLPLHYRQQIEQPVADIYSILGQDINRQQLTAKLIEALVSLLAEYEQTGFAPWQQRWLQYDAFANQQVKILGLTPVIEGIARGIDERGALLVQTTDGRIITIHGGEVSLRQSEQLS